MIFTEESELDERLDALLKPFVEARSRGGGAVEMGPARVRAFRALGYIQ